MCLAVPGKLLKVIATEPLQRTGDVQFGSVIKSVNLALVPSVAEGNYVIVHAGVAIAIVDESEAEEVIGFLMQITEAESSGR
jgi:hydrogenase expression/formation protein HypC